jgi:hypothetical protein
MKPGMPKLVAAVGTTLMDLAVIGYSGPLLWRVWGDVCLARIGLLMLAGGIAFTLMDIWAKALPHTPSRTLRQMDHESDLYIPPSATEGADV